MILIIDAAVFCTFFEKQVSVINIESEAGH